MANEIVEFKAESGALVTITPDDVRGKLCPNATDKEIFLFLELCKAQRLNPWIGDAYLVKYGDNPAQMQVGKETFTKRAASNPNFSGFEAGVTFADGQGHIRQREGSAVYSAIGETLIGGWARVHVKDKQPFYDEVALDEYNTGKSLWRSKPATMIRKVALVHALREAFPEDFAGLYSEEEMPGAPAATEVAAKVESTGKTAKARRTRKTTKASKPEASDDKASPVILDELGALADELAGIRGVDAKTVLDSAYKSKAVLQYGPNDGNLTTEKATAAIRQLNVWIKAAKEKQQDEQHDEGEALPDMPEYETD